jgi:hypothetical protein
MDIQAHDPAKPGEFSHELYTTDHEAAFAYSQIAG